MKEALKLKVTPAPHTKSSVTVTGIMLDVIIALIPACFAAAAIFGFRAAAIILTCVVSSVGFEYITRKILNRTTTIGDLSAVITGILLSLTLPVTVPLWMCVAGSFVAIVVIKQMFGGIGHNFANPAITARIVLQVSFPDIMTTFVSPAKNYIDATATATPLSYLAELDLSGDISSQISILTKDGDIPEFFNMLFGVRAGCIGEGCIAALMLGAVYLILRGIISPAIPLTFIGTTALIMSATASFNLSFTFYQILGGGLVLGAFFMATDYVTSPVSKKGKIIFGIGCGLVTALIRLFADSPEGVSYAILFMNILCPLIEGVTAPKYFGFVRKKKNTDEAIQEVTV